MSISSTATTQNRSRFAAAFLILALGAVVIFLVVSSSSTEPAAPTRKLRYEPRNPALDTSGYPTVMSQLKPWPGTATLEEVSANFGEVSPRMLREAEEQLAQPDMPEEQRIYWMISKAMVLNYQGHTNRRFPNRP